MKSEIVIECVNRLYNNYNPETSQKIRDDKISFLISELKNYKDWQFIKAVDSIVSDENIKRFPPLATIRNYMPAQEKSNTEYCVRCEQSGYYTVWQRHGAIKGKDDGHWYRHVYGCDCNPSNTFPRIDHDAIPTRAHNPYPPDDARHDNFNLRVCAKL